MKICPIGATRSSKETRVHLQVEHNIHTGIDGIGYPKPSAIHIVATTLLGQNRGFDTPSISVEVEAGTKTIHMGGGGRDTFRKFNSQWTSTAGPRT
jgi:hypothetical protein